MWRECPTSESIALAQEEGLQVYALQFSDGCIYLARLREESSIDSGRKSSARKRGTGTRRSRSKHKSGK